MGSGESDWSSKFERNLFVSSIIVGDCPKCGSINTHDCLSPLYDTHPFNSEEIVKMGSECWAARELDDPTIGHCDDCDYLWCIECGSQTTVDEKTCGHWALCEECASKHGYLTLDRIVEEVCLKCQYWENECLLDGPLICDEVWKYKCPYEIDISECPTIIKWKKTRKPQQEKNINNHPDNRYQPSLSTMTPVEYLQKRLGVRKNVAKRMVKIVVQAERRYLRWLYGYDKLKWTGYGDHDLIERLERPFVYGFFVKEVLDSKFDEGIKLKVALEAWNSTDPEKEEGVPAYLFMTLNYLLKTEGFSLDRLLYMVHLCLRLLFYSRVTVMEDERREVEDLFEYVMDRVEVPDDVKLAFLAGVLSLMDLTLNFRMKVYDRFLRDERIQLTIRRELCLNAIEDEISYYLANKLLPYLPDVLKEKITSYYIPIYMSSLPRKSIVWLAESGEDRKHVVDKYFKVKATGFDEPYQVLGVLDVCKRYSRELGMDFTVDIFRRA